MAFTIGKFALGSLTKLGMLMGSSCWMQSRLPPSSSWTSTYCHVCSFHDRESALPAYVLSGGISLPDFFYMRAMAKTYIQDSLFRSYYVYNFLMTLQIIVVYSSHLFERGYKWKNRC
jgi:hypothetical protein